jgi:hypothetical protein
MSESDSFGRLRLFVWEGFCPDYTDGLAFAIAESAEKAMELVANQKGSSPFEWGALHVHDINTPVAYSVSGGG